MASKRFYPIIAVLLTAFISASGLRSQTTDPPFLKYMNHPWVDSVLNSLSVEQQIAQTIWIAAWSDREVGHEVEVSDIIRKYGIGGLIFFQGTAKKQAELTNYYQSISKVPLIIAMDAEWGTGMRLSNVEKYPYQMTLGAIRNDSLIYRFGKEVALQFKRLGMHVNLAPVADVNINPMNPVINYRSFGGEREKVAAKTVSYMKGMQDNGILATAKHFPGHGDTDVDSHEDLPRISHARSRLDSIELYPFRRLINEGTGSIMTAHLNLPSLDTSSGLPSTLSPVIIKDLLNKQLGFKGLVITDAMNMQGITKYFKKGEADAKALQAGNDVIEFVLDVEAAINETKNYIRLNKITPEELSLKCRKILALKYWSGLSVMMPVKSENIDEELSPSSSKALIRDLYSNALTVLINNQNILPLKELDRIKVATLAVNWKSVTAYQLQVGKYIKADHFTIDPSDAVSSTELLRKLSGYDIVIAGVFGLDQRPHRKFGITRELAAFLEKLTQSQKTIITWFGNPYGTDKINGLEKADGLILAYQENNYTEELSAQLIFGGIGARGRLPVTINDRWQSDFGIITPGNIRLQYGLPESAGLSSSSLNSKIDSIAYAGLEAKAFPGCVVMVARKGIVVFHKAYGYREYDGRTMVREDDIFDLASVSKVSGSLPGFMLLDSENKFSPDETLGNYLPYFKRSDKGDLVMRDIFTHQSGLTPFIPFYRYTTREDGSYKWNTCSPVQSKRYPVMVAHNVFLHKNYRNKMLREIKKSKLGEKKYTYSDLTFIITPQIIENISGQKWDEYVTTNIYKKIGAFDLTFNPHTKYPLSRIIPTEYDSLFRKQQLVGTVHDETAGMLGGISGHAGLFATSNDLMKLMELYRRMGSYGGEQIINRSVMEEYTKVQFPDNLNRRGLGFDKPLLNNSQLPPKEAYPTYGASPSSFGHAGYTGTFVWVDPEKEVSYIFFSNRVYPTRNNNLISSLNIRGSILQAVYDSITE
jgi:beta-glucosidase-like glycosyl hydrolase/CubicO group peptidase (beta-lactamase class C family)